MAVLTVGSQEDEVAAGAASCWARRCATAGSVGPCVLLAEGRDAVLGWACMGGACRLLAVLQTTVS